MDEIIIEEKKYVSSKQAAKMTGYAKDYVGQLCREGRVPARLVGRSWYVLESAIQDHRFGAEEPESTAINTTVEVTDQWESPRYEAVHTEILPSLHRTSDDDVEEDRTTQDIHESWREWFDQVGGAAPEVVSLHDAEGSYEDAPKEIPQEAVKVEKETPILVQTMSQPLLSREFLPRDMQVEERVAPVSRREEQKRGGMTTLSIQAAGALVAIVMLALAFVGSGYFDEYLISQNQASIVTGAVLFSR